MSNEIKKTYEHKNFESDIYDFWLRKKLFDPFSYETKSKCKKFSIILPPPNITGHLHIGHAWDGYIQDAIIRYKKLSGFQTLFVPGTDHAGISAQTKFEKVLQTEKKIKRDTISDEKFIELLREWSNEQKKYIRTQWEKLGLALAYDYELFTLDDSANKIVNKLFVQLYNEKLIYRDNKLVNWDVKLKTAISDIEVIHKETKGELYYLKYKVFGVNDEYIAIATTRPETMFVDIAVFVNPTDERYKKYIGKFVINPINNEKIPVLADQYIDKNFGTGAMKCTPAHDFNDYDLAIKNKINKFKNVLNDDGTLNNLAKTPFRSFEGIDRIKARIDIVSDLEKVNSLLKKEEYVSNVGYSERTNEIVEPFLSLQWFVKMKEIASNYLKQKKKSKVSYFPNRFQKEMQRWLNNMNDWCISRQLLWGHKIPIWYNKKNNNEIYCGVEPPNSNDFIQDKDVLDTWFSSGLWPLSTTKFSLHSEKIKEFYPISVLVTGYDILFFWVARMLLQCSYLDNTIPFKNVFLHGLVRDSHGRKMSKSLNNGVDPMDVIEKYGSDSLRMFLLSTSTAGEDLKFSEEKIKYMWSFINKMWNAHIFIKDHVPSDTMCYAHKKIHFDLITLWFAKKFNDAIIKYKKNMDKYNFVISFKIIEELIWDTFCNKYIELIRPFINDNKFSTNLLIFFNLLLVIIHPFAPFVTEKMFNNFNPNKSIMLEKISKIINFPKNKYIFEIDIITEILFLAKKIRINNSFKKNDLLEFNIICNHELHVNLLNKYLSMHSVHVDQQKVKKTFATTIFTFNNFSVEFLNNKKNEKENDGLLEKKLANLKLELERSEKILNNNNFLNKASKEKINEEKKKQKNYKEQYEQVINKINELKKNK